MAKKPRPVYKTPTAERKIKEIVKWSARRWGKQTARAYLANLEEVIKMVAAGETLAKKRPEFSKRFSCCVAKRHYIFFEVRKDRLVVATIFHTAMHVKERMREEMSMIEREIDETERWFATSR